jgi:rSAM/selenodomain-associated transferase 1
MLFVKWPEAGRVKTRIAQVVGNERAAEIYRELVRRVLVNLRPILSEVESVWMVFDPVERAREVSDWLESEAESAGWDLSAVEFLPQVRGDLGARLRGAFEQAFGAGFDQVSVAGTDCVELGAGQVAEAFRAEADVVFGPARDGGYYLARLNGIAGCAVFDGVPWSSEETLASSVRAAKGAGLEVELLEELGDVDTIEDWQRVGEAMR